MAKQLRKNGARASRPIPAIGVASQTGYGRLRDLIRADIVEGRLASGERLKVAGLAARYETSTIPVREALQQLQGEGIVTFAPNRGASVRPIDGDFIRDIHEVRELAEPFLAAWFVRNHTDAQIAELAAVQRQYDAASRRGDLQRIRKLNRRFHQICYDGHYNAEALAVAYRHSDLIMALSYRFPSSRARTQAICSEHWAIIEAIRRQDEAATARLVAAHVRNAGRFLIEMMTAATRKAAG